MGQNHFSQKSLTFSDRKIRKIIDRGYPIDRKTFCNVTPGSDYPYWVGNLRSYRAMEKNWIAYDPPGSPTTFYVAPSHEIFLDIKEALHAINYMPKNNEAALRAAVMIAHEDLQEANIIFDTKGDITDIPESIVLKYASNPSVVKKNHVYTSVVYSYISRRFQNRFKLAYHALFKHVITIEGNTYKDAITALWEKKEE